MLTVEFGVVGLSTIAAPKDVHIPVPLLGEFPDNVINAEEQANWSTPAFARMMESTKITTVSSLEHPPLLNVHKNSLGPYTKLLTEEFADVGEATVATPKLVQLPDPVIEAIALSVPVNVSQRL